MRDDRRVVIVLGLFGAALLYGDGMITPAISVLSAVEGLEVAAPASRAVRAAAHRRHPRRLVRRSSAAAPRGSAGCSARSCCCGSSSLAVLGIGGIVRHPAVLAAVNPLARRPLLRRQRSDGFLVLGARLPGGDRRRGALRRHGPLRHAGRSGWPGSPSSCPACCSTTSARARCCSPDPAEAAATRSTTWRRLGALPAGRAGHGGDGHRLAGGDLRRLLAHPPGGAARLLPRLTIDHTSADEIGQIYMPAVNWVLMLATIALVLGFRHLEPTWPRPTAWR